MAGWNFQHFDLGHQRRGATIVVTLRGNAANVRLLDASNFASYRAGRNHRYYGGQAQRSPVRLGVPNDGRWHLVVDLVGLAGSVNIGVEVEPPPPEPLPVIRDVPPAARPLRSIADNVAAVAPASPALGKSYDVFISHAAEDKEPVVRELADALEERGVAVWYDEFALKVGDSLRRRIDAGLASSRFGVVVLSPSFFAKNWAQYELDGLVTREMLGQQQIILPIWHGVDAADVAARSPSLADKVALRTSQLSIDEIADQIAEAAKPAAG